jgi:hypothetical protein
MKKIVTLLFTIVPLISFGQKNEIGIGIGTLQYTTGAYIPKNSKSIKNSFFFTKKNKIIFYGYDQDEYSQTKNSPIIYYSLKLFKKINLRASYQYTTIKTHVYPFRYYDMDCFPSYYITYENYFFQTKINELNIGSDFSFINKKRYSIYAGVEININNQKEYESANGTITDFENKISLFNYSLSNTKFNYSYNFPLGIKLNLSKSFNIKYEASFFYPDAFRPINRLSINYLF